MIQVEASQLKDYITRAFIAHMKQNNCDMDLTHIDGFLLRSGWFGKKQHFLLRSLEPSLQMADFCARPQQPKIIEIV